MFENAPQLGAGDPPFMMNQSQLSLTSTLPNINPKPSTRSLPRLVTTFGSAPCTPPPASNTSQAVPPFSFDRVAAAIWTYRIALLNFENSSPEEKGPNGRALDQSVETLQQIFDSYNQLTKLTRQLVGVFLKELYFESTKGKRVAEGSQSAEPRGTSPDTPSHNNGVSGVDNGE